METVPSGARPRPTRRSALIGGAVAAAMLGRGTARAAVALRLGHALPSSHPVHQSMRNFAEIVAERTLGEVTITLFGDGLLGQEPDLIEQVRAGSLDFTKVSASVLDAVNPKYQAFNIPFLLRDRDHWRRVVTGAVGDGILAQEGGPLFGLTFYDAGARSFYGQRSVRRPEDLRGLKIRVQPSPSTVRMIELLGAQPMPLPWGLVYSALQTRLVDGAENNLTALTYGRHAEVIKYFSLTEHTMVPDVLLMGRRAWDRLSDQQRGIVRTAAVESALLQSFLWEEAENASRLEAERMGIVFENPDKAAFAAELAPIKREFAERAGLGPVIAQIDAA